MASGKGIFGVILGAAEITAGILITIGTFGGGAFVGASLILAGAGQLLAGIGTLMSGSPPEGSSTATRNPIAPWDIVYGKTRVGGTLVYLHTWGGDYKVLDMIVVVAAHHCDSLQEVLFDQQRLQIDPTKISPGAGYGSGTSFSPTQQKTFITSITRDARGVVTVVLPANIPYLTAGDQILILDSGGGSALRAAGLTGRVQVAQITSQVFGSPGSITFTFLSGGTAVSLSTGEIRTTFIDHGNYIYIETMGFGGPSAPMGNQTLGQTFPGMLNGTPYRGDPGTLVSPTSYGHLGESLPHGSIAYNTDKNPITPNPWTANCSLVGKSAVFIRIEFREDDRALQTIPQISFLIQGKNDIYDPNTLGTGYTDNAALCIADFLSNQTWGFKANYGSDIPDQPLKDAIAICNQDIPLLHGGTEKCWACDGHFNLDMKRGEILQNLLTSCGGRLTYAQGQYVIHPAYSPVSTGLTAAQQYTPLAGVVDFEAIAAGPMRWRPTTSIRDLYNGVKGTYYSPEHHWEVADFPPYAQDVAHGYSGGDINLAFDGGDRRWLDVQLPFTTSYARAQRLAKIELLRRRAQGGASRGTGTFVCNMAGYQYATLDILQAAVSFFGWTTKQLEIAAVRLRYEKTENDAFMLATEIDVQEVDSDIYTWVPGTLSVQGEELTPQGYITGQLPVSQIVEAFPYPWSPGYVSPLSGDAYPGPASFGVQPVYGTDAQGNGTITLQVKGATPINQPNTGIFPPQISAAALTSGGTLAAGSYVVALSARGSGSAPFRNTDYLDYGYCTITGSTGSITVTIAWSPGDDGGDLYLAKSNGSENYQFHYAGVVSPGASTASITSLDLTAAGGPDPDLDHFAVEWQPVIHSGPFSAPIRAVTSTTITLAGDGMTTNQWAGYPISLVAKNDPSVEIAILNMPIASSTASSGGLFVLTIGANSLGQTLPNLTTLLAAGDIVAMRHHATFTANSFSDANIANPYYPSGASGIVEAGHVAVVLSGANAGDVQTISGVTGGTTFNLAGSWTITPATGDMVIICAASSAPEISGSPISASNSLTGIVAAVGVQNLANATWLFRVRTEDLNGVHSDDRFAPFREVYLFGAGSFSTLPPDNLSFNNLTTDSDGNVILSALQVGTNAGIVNRATCELYSIDGTQSGSTTEIHGSVAPGDLTITFAVSAPAERTYYLIDQEIVYVQSVSSFVATVLRAQFGTTAATHAAQNTSIGTVNSLWPLDLIVGTGLAISPGMRASDSSPAGNSFVSEYVPGSGLVRLSAPLGAAPTVGGSFHAYPLMIPLVVTSQMIAVPTGFFTSGDTGGDWSVTIPLSCSAVVYAQVKATSVAGIDSPWFGQPSLTANPLYTHGGNSFTLTFPQIPAGATPNAFQAITAPMDQDFFGSYAQISNLAGAVALPIPVPVAASVLTPVGLTATGSITLGGSVDATSQVQIGSAGFLTGGRRRGNYVNASSWASDSTLTTLTAMATSLAAWLNADRVFGRSFSASSSGAVVSIFDLTSNGGTVTVVHSSGATSYTPAGFTSTLGILTGRRYAFAYIDTTDPFVSDLSNISDSSGPTGSYSSVSLDNIPISTDSRVNFIDIYGYPDGTTGPTAYKIARIANTSSDGSGFTGYLDTQVESGLTGLTAFPGPTQPSQAADVIVKVFRNGIEWFELHVPPNAAQSNIISGLAMRGLSQGALVTVTVLNNIAALDLKVTIR